MSVSFDVPYALASSLELLTDTVASPGSRFSGEGVKGLRMGYLARFSGL